MSVRSVSAVRSGDVTVVIPVHNEAGFLPSAVAEMVTQVGAVCPGFGFVLVENGSSDTTLVEAEAAVAAYPNGRVLRLSTADYGAAVRAGMVSAAAESGWVVLFDIDYFSGLFVQQTLEAEKLGCDVLLASKRVPDAEDSRPWLRRLATAVFNFLLRCVVGTGVSDTHGMKAVRSEVVEQLEPLVVSDGSLFDTELVLRAERAGFRIREVPALVEEMRETSSPIWKRVLPTLRGLWVLRGNLGASTLK